jgi:hypothetical protein
MQIITPESPCLAPHLCLLLESLGEALDVLLEDTLVAEELDVATVDLDLALSAPGNVLLATETGEAPVLGDNDLLATRELHSLVFDAE